MKEIELKMMNKRIGKKCVREWTIALDDGYVSYKFNFNYKKSQPHSIRSLANLIVKSIKENKQ